jgi:hypothetical protein
MIRNKELVSRAKVFARNRGEKDRESVLAMVEGYEVACGLSLGPDSSRSAVWERKAAERRNALCRAIGDSE